jgi:hypothetical protein
MKKCYSLILQYISQTLRKWQTALNAWKDILAISIVDTLSIYPSVCLSP